VLVALAGRHRRDTEPKTQQLKELPMADDDDAAAFRRQVYGDTNPREREAAAPLSLRGRRLFIRGLAYDWDRDRCRRELGRFGAVERLELPRAKRGTCVVDYASARAASTALVALDGKRVAGRRDLTYTVAVEATFAPPVDELPEENEDELVCPVEFAGRGSRAEKEKERRKHGRGTLFCPLCGGADHFDQGCRLRDVAYHRAVAAGELDPATVFLPAAVAPAPAPAPAPAAPATPLGRGRGVSVPAWMADPGLAAAAAARAPAPAPRRSPSRSRSPPRRPERTERRRSPPPPRPERTERRGQRGGRRRADPPRDAAAEMRALDPYADQSAPRGFACALAGDGLHAVSDGERLELRRAFPSGLVLAIDATPPKGLARRDVDAATAASDRHAAANVALRAAMAAAPFSLDDSVRVALARGGAPAVAAAASVGEAVAVLAACGDAVSVALPAGARCLWSPDHCAFYYVDAAGAMSWEPPAAAPAPAPPRRGPSPPRDRHHDRRPRGWERDRRRPASSSYSSSRRGRY